MIKDKAYPDRMPLPFTILRSGRKRSCAPMAGTLRKIVITLIGRRLTALYVSCSTIAHQLVLEFHRMRGLIRCRERGADDPEFVLGELRTWAHIVDKGLRAENWEPDRGGTANPRRRD